MLYRVKMAAIVAVLALAGCESFRDVGCNTMEAACRNGCLSGDAAERAACRERCAAQNPCQSR
jgi:hypothetical protein